MTILWRDSMKVGEPRIDQDHKKFIAMLNLTERGLQQKDVAPATEIFTEMTNFVESHFAAEEAYMEKIGYPGLEVHRKHHETLTYRFYVLLGRFNASANDAERRRHVIKLAEFMREWLIEHLLKEVIELKPYAPTDESGPAVLPWVVPTLTASLGLVTTNTPDTGVAVIAAATTAKVVPVAHPTEAIAAARAETPTEPPAGEEWRSVGTVPTWLQKYASPLEYNVPKIHAITPEFDSFKSLCEGAIWRSVSKLLVFFQRHNESVIRELPPLFVASPEFARNLKRVLDMVIFPEMWQSRRMRMLLTNFDREMADDETFFVKLGDRHTEHVLTVWSQAWTGLRLVEGTRDGGTGAPAKIKEETKRVREMLQPPTEQTYDLPKVGNRELEILKGLLDPDHDWAGQFQKLWRQCHHFYVQEKTPAGDPDIREGTFRDNLLEIFNSLPDPWGEFLF